MAIHRTLSRPISSPPEADRGFPGKSALSYFLSFQNFETPEAEQVGEIASFCFLAIQNLGLRLCFVKNKSRFTGVRQTALPLLMRKPENQSGAVEAALARTLLAECSTAALTVSRRSEDHGAGMKAGMAQPLLTMSQVMAATTYSRPSIYRLMGEGKFPAPLKLGASRIAFVAQEIDQWLATRPRAGADRSGRLP